MYIHTYIYIYIYIYVYIFTCTYLCIALQHTAMCCNTLQHMYIYICHAATRCNVLQHTATHVHTHCRCENACNMSHITVQRTATHAHTHCSCGSTYNILHNPLQHATTRCNTCTHENTNCGSGSLSKMSHNPMQHKRDLLQHVATLTQSLNNIFSLFDRSLCRWNKINPNELHIQHTYADPWWQYPQPFWSLHMQIKTQWTFKVKCVILLNIQNEYSRWIFKKNFQDEFHDEFSWWIFMMNFQTLEDNFLGLFGRSLRQLTINS